MNSNRSEIWVTPTAFSIVAIKQFTVCNRSEASEKRVRLGVAMLLDRVCVTLATALLGLKCGEMIHPFMVLQ